MTDLIAIASSTLSAEIDPHGAQLSSLRDAEGRDLLWSGDPSVWSSRAPILFPIVGSLAKGRYRLGSGSPHPLPRHGFARHQRFEVAEAERSAAVFILRSNPETQKVYPFTFEVKLRFAIVDQTLSLTATVKNAGNQSMPASFGFHPAFCWPLPYGRPRAEHEIAFAQAELAPIRRIDSRGLVKPDPLPTPVEGAILKLKDALFIDDAVIFDQLVSHQLRYGAKDGPALTITFPDTPYLGVWTKPGADFIAIEPWHGLADPEGFSGDIWSKPGIFTVAPGEAKAMSMSVTLSPG